MHSKDRGTLGEISIAKDLMRRGYPVFKEIGDNSRIDLIALIKGKCIRIQVKSYRIDRGVVIVSAKKSGPNYSFTYKANDFEIFGIYVLETDQVAYVKLSDVLATQSKKFAIRILPSKNKQTKGTRPLKDYASLEKALGAIFVARSNFRFSATWKRVT